jgi:hypothetical protein
MRRVVLTLPVEMMGRDYSYEVRREEGREAMFCGFIDCYHCGQPVV